jgi:rRNA maturation RNase YbeY
MQATVRFNSGDRKLVFPKKTELRSFLAGVFKKEGTRLESLDFIFCSDEMLLQINRDFLQHDYYTDIISFDLGEKGQPVQGEIYISVERVKENARDLGVSYREEMLRVLVHGILHLCGYKDKKKSDIAEMRAAEDKYIRLYRKK